MITRFNHETTVLLRNSRRLGLRLRKAAIVLSSETHLVPVFSPYILQNRQGKSNNSILDQNTLQHEKQGIT